MIPLRTDIQLRRVPWANFGLIAVNVLVYVVMDVLWVKELASLKENVLTLNPIWPHWWQYITYQFLHSGESLWHLTGNMLFLWVFGNAVNSRLGHGPYLMFYMAGGIFSGWGYALNSDHLLIGASGAIAAVTTAYLAFFPRSHILFLFWFIIIGTFELPSLYIIIFKIILWDNVVSPSLGSNALEQVAYSAHLFGYFAGFTASMLMMWTGMVTRDQFDMAALWRRWNQRRIYSEMLQDPQARARAQYGTVARPIMVGRKAAPDNQLEAQIQELRSRIHEALGRTHADPQVIEWYEQLQQLDNSQILARQYQLDVAKQYYSTSRFPQAAAAFEKYLQAYPKGDQRDEILLLLGIIYVRDLQQPELARRYLLQAVELLPPGGRREQAQSWLIQTDPAGASANPPVSDSQKS
ncbi:MAG: hypothetical protein HJJLKODD_00291 [Phycisphaerae bacterium]|nr:hypothetical protein [Phycisphaerae bacterium]